MQKRERKMRPQTPRTIEMTPIVRRSVSVNPNETMMTTSTTILKTKRARRQKKVELFLSAWPVRTKKFVQAWPPCNE